jgi:hypothetical protein
MPRRIIKFNYGTIYVLKNIINNKYYVGQTSRELKYRLKEHLKYNYSVISRAIKKYDFNNFKVYQFEGIPVDLLDYAEQELIYKLNSEVPNGYNVDKGGYVYRIFGDTTRKKMSNSAKNKIVTEETKNKMSKAKIGKKFTKEHRIKIGLSQIGRIQSEETKNKISNTKKLRHYPSSMLGKHHSTETKNKISKTRIDRKIPIWNTGIKSSEETKLKISMALKGRKPTNSIKIRCVETNEIFNAIKLASEKYKICDSNIVSCLKGRLNSAGKYHWEYYKEEL